MLLCTVRGCGQSLTRDGSRYVCARNHSFDIARSGYVNLLQPHDRRSKQPGDTVEAVAGRRRLHDLGVTGPLFDAIADVARTMSGDSVLDAGCGEGFYLGQLAAKSGGSGHGVDISIAAIDAAARRYPNCEWIVANADRMVPYSDASFTLILSITGRRHPTEFLRVLRPEGRVLVAIPAPDDLIELRGRGQDRVQRTVDEFVPIFRITEKRRVTTSGNLDAQAVEDLRHAIYRPLHSEPAAPTSVTFSLDLLLFEPA
jgi:23S rRNA (guanine745-N1)-methyltransferase